MKKVLSIILAFTMLLSFASVSLAATPVAEKLDSTSIVNVTGKVENGTYVNILLLDANDEVKHIQEVKPESDGSYRAKFKFSESTEGLKLQVKQGNADVTDSVISAVLEKEAVSYTLSLANTASSTIAAADIENWFNVTDKTYTLMTAFYDENNMLIYVTIDEKRNVNFDENNTELYVPIPENAAKIKAFLWDSTETMIPLAKEKETKPLKDEINILVIGNSFTDDPTAYLKPVANADGITINLYTATHGGASILQHWTNHVEGNLWYNSKTVDGETVYTKTLTDYLDYDKNGNVYYDFVTFQQVSNYSGMIETYGFDEYDTEKKYDHCAENLAKLIREYQPTAEIVLQQTWAYEKGSTHNAFPNYDSDQTTMHNAIKSTVETACELLAKVETDSGLPVSLNGEPLRYIPTGDAFMNARQSEIFDTTYGKYELVPNALTLHRDSYHSSFLYGRYLGAIVWYGSLTGNSPVLNAYEHKYTTGGVTYQMDSDAKEILKKAAQKAIDDYGRWN